MNGFELRRFFATLLVFWHGDNCKDFFDSHVRILSEDFLSRARRIRSNAGLDQNIINCVLAEIGKALIELGSSLSSKGLPVPPNTEISTQSSLSLSMSFDPNAVTAQYETLNGCQKAAFDTVLQAVREKRGGLFF